MADSAEDDLFSLDAIDDLIDSKEDESNEKVKFFLQAQATSTLDQISGNVISALSNPPKDASGRIITSISGSPGLNEMRVLGWLANVVPTLALGLVNGLQAIRAEMMAELLFNGMSGHGTGGMDFAILLLLPGGLASGNLLGNISGNQVAPTMIVSGWNGTYQIP